MENTDEQKEKESLNKEICLLEERVKVLKDLVNSYFKDWRDAIIEFEPGHFSKSREEGEKAICVIANYVGSGDLRISFLAMISFPTLRYSIRGRYFHETRGSVVKTKPPTYQEMKAQIAHIKDTFRLLY